MKTLLLFATFAMLLCGSSQAQNTEKAVASLFRLQDYGKKTLSGEYLSSKLFTAAHNVYPIGSIVEVSDPKSGRSVTVRIIEGATASPSHDIELSHSAGQNLGMISGNVREVTVKVLSKGFSKSDSLKTALKAIEIPTLVARKYYGFFIDENSGKLYELKPEIFTRASEKLRLRCRDLK
jgi:rare lipoprotein A